MQLNNNYQVMKKVLIAGIKSNFLSKIPVNLSWVTAVQKVFKSTFILKSEKNKIKWDWMRFEMKNLTIWWTDTLGIMRAKLGWLECLFFYSPITRSEFQWKKKKVSLDMN